MLVWRRYIVVSLIAVAFLTVGCGVGARFAPSTTPPSESSSGASGSSSTSPTSSPRAPAIYRPVGTAQLANKKPQIITAINFGFRPNTLSAPKGIAVVLDVTNASTVPHTFTLPAFGVNVALPAGKTVTVQFAASKSGIFYFSSTNPGDAEQGMVGKLTVQ